MITIVDYGMGNLGSIANLCRHLGIAAQTSADPETIAAAEKLVLPGVGAFGAAITRLENLGMREALEHAACKRGTPLLGICLGMQLLSETSEEGGGRGLGFIRGHTRRITTPPGSTTRLLIPHMGWNTVSVTPGAKLLAGIAQPPRFYFVHSYHVVCENMTDVAATVHYGADLTASIEHGNIFGTQFHPEKSHRYGMQLMRNFSSL